MSAQEWWDEISEDLRNALARDPHGPVPSMLVHRVVESKGPLIEDTQWPPSGGDPAGFHFSGEVQDLIEADNDALVKRLTDQVSHYQESIARAKTPPDQKNDSDDPDLSHLMADLHRANARGLRIPEEYRYESR